jgi:hypothetical protein
MGDSQEDRTMNARTVFLARLTGVFLLVLSLAMLALTSRARLPSIAYYPVPPKAHRWIGEMNELAATYQATGLTLRMLAGAAALYRDAGQTTLGREPQESRRAVTRSFDAFIVMLQRDKPRA